STVPPVPREIGVLAPRPGPLRLRACPDLKNSNKDVSQFTFRARISPTDAFRLLYVTNPGP
ncbi:MAG: hypothetical protein ACI39M_17160, partial [Streptomyces albidoflavus]